MNAPMTPDVRAAIAAGRLLHAKDGANLDPILRAIEDNNRAIDTRLRSVEDTKATAEELSARMLELEQKTSRRGGGEPAAPKSWGEQFTASPELKTLAENTSRPGRFRTEMKSTVTLALDSAGSLISPTRDGVVMLPRRRLAVRDLLPVLRVSIGSAEYARQTTRPDAPAMVAEGP